MALPDLYLTRQKLERVFSFLDPENQKPMNSLAETEKQYHEAQQKEKEIENLKQLKSESFESKKNLVIGLNNHIAAAANKFINNSDSEIQNLKILTEKLEILVKEKLARKQKEQEEKSSRSESSSTKPEKVIDHFQHITFTTNNDENDDPSKEKENYTKKWMEYNKSLKPIESPINSERSSSPELEILQPPKNRVIISFPQNINHPNPETLNHNSRQPKTRRLKTPSPEPIRPRNQQQYSPKNKNLKYKEEMTFSFLAPASQGKYIRDCTKKVYLEQTEDKFQIKQLDDETLLIFTATRPGQINAVLQHTMQDFELTSKRSQKPSKKLAYLIDKSEKVRKMCMDLESVEITELKQETIFNKLYTMKIFTDNRLFYL